MTKQEELILLDRVKKELMDCGILRVNKTTMTGQLNILEIYSDEWHRIFKTEEFNKLNKEK